MFVRMLSLHRRWLRTRFGSRYAALRVARGTHWCEPSTPSSVLEFASASGYPDAFFRRVSPCSVLLSRGIVSEPYALQRQESASEVQRALGSLIQIPRSFLGPSRSDNV
jgi:hypothetical protein